MKAIKALIKHEFRFFLLRPWSHAWLLLWVSATTAVAMLHGQILHAPQVQLGPFFSYLPWLGALFLPALGINLWSRESRLETRIWLLSLPHSTLRCLLIKYAAAWMLMALGLLLTWPLTATLIYLGNPDLGVIASSYIGTLGYLSVQLALCLVASCLTTRPMSSYALGLAFCLAYNLPGCDLLSESLPPYASSGLFTQLSRWSGSHHLLGFLRGVIDSRDIFYWILSVTCLISAAYGLLVKSRTAASTSWRHPERRTLYGLFAYSAFVSLLLVLTFSVHSRWDLTEDDLYTLSDGSVAIVGKLPEPVHVRLFVSRSHPALEPALRSHSQRIEELLREFVALAPMNFSYSLVDPLSDPALEMEARLHGLTAVGSSASDPIFFGAIYTMGQQTLGLPYFDPQREDQLEYEIVEALVKISQKSKPVLGIMSALPMMREQGVRDWAIVSALRNLYQVIPLPLSSESIAANVHTLLVIHPKNIGEKTEFALDQFVMRGGNLLLALDPLCRSELTYNNQLTVQPGSPLQLASNLPRLLKAWGLDFSAQKMVGDLGRKTPLQTAHQIVDYPFNLSLQAEDLNASHLISNRIRQLIFSESGWFSGYRDNGLHWNILAQTSPESAGVSTSLANFMQASTLSEQVKPDGQQRVLAGVLFGRFFTAFPKPPAGSPLEAPLREADRDNAVVLFADVDFMADHHTVDKVQSRSQMILKPKNDNLSFFLRAVEFAGGNKDLIAVRNNRRLLRPFLRFQRLQQESQSRWQESFDKIGLELQSIEAQLESEQNPEEDQALASVEAEQEQRIKQLREEEARLRAEQRRVRLSMQEPVSRLRKQLIWGNLLITPFTLAIFWGGLLGRRRWPGKRSVQI